MGSNPVPNSQFMAGTHSINNPTIGPIGNKPNNAVIVGQLVSANPARVVDQEYNAMRFKVPSFNLESLIPPIRMIRETPKRFAITETERKKLEKFGKFNNYLKTSIQMQKQQAKEDRQKQLERQEAARLRASGIVNGIPSVLNKSTANSSSSSPSSGNVKKELKSVDPAGGSSTSSSTPTLDSSIRTPGNTSARGGKPKEQKDTDSKVGTPTNTESGSSSAHALQKRGQAKTRTRVLYFARDSQMEDDSGNRVHNYDPDKHPWNLSDFDGSNQYRGTLEGSKQPSMVFMLPIETKVLPDGSESITKFRILPMNKTYKFTKKIHEPFDNEIPAGVNPDLIQRLRNKEIPGAQDKLNDFKSRLADKKQLKRELRNASLLEEERAKEADIKERNAISNMRKKGGKYLLLSAMLRQEDDLLREGRKKIQQRRQQEDSGGGMDYDEEFADDEEVRLGIDNADDEKEALDRQYGKLARKAGFDEDDVFSDDEFEEVDKDNAKDRVLQKTLRRTVDEDVYANDKSNPYLSDDDDDDEIHEIDGKEVKDEEEAKLNADLQGALSPSLSSEASGSSSRRSGSTRGGSKKGGSQKSPLGRLTPGSTSPNSVRSPLYTATSKSQSGSAHSHDNSNIKLTLGKRKTQSSEPSSANSADNELSNKRLRGSTSPLSSTSASEILKQYTSSTSPLGRGGSNSPQERSQSTSKQTSQSVRSATGGKPKGSLSTHSEGGTTKPKPKKKKSKNLPTDSGNTEGRKVTQQDVINYFKQRNTDTVGIKDLANELLQIAGVKNSAVKDELRILLKDMVQADGNKFHLLEKYR